MGKGSERSQKGKGKELQSMNERDEWDQTEDHTSVPILSMSCGEKQSEANPADQWQVPVKRVKSICVKTESSNKQFVCNNKFETITEHEHEEKTRQAIKRVRFDSVRDASTSCGSGCAEQCEADPKPVGILLSSSSESEPLCEMSSEWTPMQQPLVVDCDAAET